MNASTRKVSQSGMVIVRGFASQSAPKSHDLHKGQVGKVRLEQTKLPNGVPIIALENNSPISRVGVLVRAGSRFEGIGQLGVTHTLRNAAGLSTKMSTKFGITRNTDYAGGSLTCTGTREDLLYVVDGMRDQIATPVAFLGDTVTRPLFKPWELSDNDFRLKIDSKRMKNSPDVRLIELLHKAAFASGLSNSLYSPDFMIGKHDHDLVNIFVNEYFTAGRMAIVGLGVDLQHLVDQVEKTFEFNNLSAPQIVKPKFIAGNLRKETGSKVSYVAVAAEGASSKNKKEAVALSLFEQILGAGIRVKYSDGKVSPLGAAASQATQHPFALTGINVSYSDTGLFGFAVGAAGADIHNVVKAIVKKMREVGKGLNEGQVKTAKHQLKASTMMSLELPGVLLEELAAQAVNGSPLEVDKLESIIDSVSLNDVKEAASKVLKGKVAIAAVGQTRNVPFVEDLV